MVDLYGAAGEKIREISRKVSNSGGQFQPFGNGQVTAESTAELDNTNAEWQAATADMDRIAKERRSGKRR